MLLMSFFRQACLVEGGLAIVAILAAPFVGIDYWTHCWCDGKTLQQTAWAILPLVAGYCVLQMLPLTCLKQIDQFVRTMYWQYMGHLTLGQLAVIATLAGLGEEFFFRGLIQLGLSDVCGVGLAILLTSLLFGLAHAITLTYVILAFIISLYLGFLFDWTDNLFVPIAVHALYDFFVFLFIRLTPQRT